MNESIRIDDSTLDFPAAPDRNADLEAVLAAWHAATVRLEKTHTALQEEVARLTSELEVKNRELARRNRLADLGQMASHVAHEVRNNLVPVSLYLSLLRRRLDGESGHLDVVGKIETGLTALDATVNDLLHFTAEREPQRQDFSARRLVEEVCDALAPQMEAQGIVVQLDVPANEQVAADRDMLRRALMNLALNALDAMPEGGELVITSYRSESGWDLEVADSGPGLEEPFARRVFEPFYSTKQTGTGLGLAIVDRIAESHGGAATALNCPEGGAAFTIHIPSHRATLEAAA